MYSALLNIKLSVVSGTKKRSLSKRVRQAMVLFVWGNFAFVCASSPPRALVLAASNGVQSVQVVRKNVMGVFDLSKLIRARLLYYMCLF